MIRRLVVSIAAAVLVLAGLSAPAYASTTTVRFDVGGHTCSQPNCAVNSASVPWGTYVQLSSGWSEIKAVGQGSVMCKITDSAGHVLDMKTASVAGTSAFCHFTA